MPRQPRNDLQNQIYHVINRANKRAAIFTTTGDYQLFENTLIAAQKRFSMRILAYTAMPNHIHLVLYPHLDGQMAKFMHWFTTTLTQRWHKKHDSVGNGHIFQGRYKSFLVRDEKYLSHLLLYVERNALRANFVERAQQWRWSSLWIRYHGTPVQRNILTAWPIEVPENYLEAVNWEEDEKITERIRASITKSAPLDKNDAPKNGAGRPKKLGSDPNFYCDAQE